jgi:putative membrane protein
MPNDPALNRRHEPPWPGAPVRGRAKLRAKDWAKKSVAALALAAGFVPLAPAQDASAKLSATDQQFVQDAGTAGATEIAASKLALSKSNDAQVKRVAQRMIADHAKLARNLDAVVKRHGITPPASADSSVVGSLQNLQGADFDKAYIEKVAVGGHQKAVELFKKESENGNDAQLKSAAARALPIIEHHYQMAQQLAKARA